MTECWPEEWPLDAIRLIEEGEEKAETLETTNAELLEALKEFVRVHDCGGFVEPDYDVIEQAKQAIRDAEEQA